MKCLNQWRQWAERWCIAGTKVEFSSPGDIVKPAAYSRTNKCIFCHLVWHWISLAGVREAVRPDTSTTGLDLWTRRIFSAKLLFVVLFRHWFVSGWGAFLPYIFLNVEETHCNVSQETLKGLWCTQGSKFKPGFAGFNQASQRPPAFVLQSICVCVWHGAWTSRDAMKPQAAEHFAHVRIIVMNTITHVEKSGNDVHINAGSLLHCIWLGHVVSVYVCVCVVVYMFMYTSGWATVCDCVCVIYSNPDKYLDTLKRLNVIALHS